MIDWIPIVLIVFKVLVLGAGMFFAIKWHYDQGEKERDKAKETRELVRAGGKAVAVFVLALLCLMLATFFVSKMLGLNLTSP